MRRLLTSLLPLVLFALPAGAAEPVTGWKDFRLGMSLDKALAAAPDISWGEDALADCRERVRIDKWGCTVRTQDYETRIGNLTFELAASFDEERRLTEIKLLHAAGSPYGSPVSAHECESRFRYMLEPLESKYGKMTGPDKTLRRKNKTTDEWESIPAETKNTPLGGSYQIPLDKEDYRNLTIRATTNLEAFAKWWQIDDTRPIAPHIVLEVSYNKLGYELCRINVLYLEGFAPSGEPLKDMENQL